MEIRHGVDEQHNDGQQANTVVYNQIRNFEHFSHQEYKTKKHHA
jgi:hypothetical protein